MANDHPADAGRVHGIEIGSRISMRRVWATAADLPVEMRSRFYETLIAASVARTSIDKSEYVGHWQHELGDIEVGIKVAAERIDKYLIDRRKAIARVRGFFHLARSSYPEDFIDLLMPQSDVSILAELSFGNNNVKAELERIRGQLTGRAFPGAKALTEAIRDKKRADRRWDERTRYSDYRARDYHQDLDDALSRMSDLTRGEDDWKTLVRQHGRNFAAIRGAARLDTMIVSQLVDDDHLIAYAQTVAAMAGPYGWETVLFDNEPRTKHDEMAMFTIHQVAEFDGIVRAGIEPALLADFALTQV